MKSIIAGVSLSVLLFLIFPSCTRIDTTALGSDLIPAVDNVNTFETVLDVHSNNLAFEEDTIGMFSSLDHAIGIIENDPEFGKTDAALYFTLEPTAFGIYPFLNKDSVIIDSLVLSLGYNQTYGDTNSVQVFEVREISQAAEFRKDSIYSIMHPDFPVLPEVLGSKQVQFLKLKDSLVYDDAGDTVKTSRELRIKLDTNFARRFVSLDTSNGYKNDTNFKSFFKGFQVKSSETSPTKNALAYFDITDNDRTKLTFYCRVVRNGKMDTIAPLFAFLNDPQANIVRRTPANGYQDNLNNGLENDEKIYIQSSPGSYATIKIPGIDTLNNRVVHLAELIMEKVPGTNGDNFFAGPDLLFLDVITPDGDSAITLRKDFIPVAGSGFNSYDFATLGGYLKNDRYVFNITRYLQGIVTLKEPNYPLRVYAPFITSPWYTPAIGAATTRITLLVNQTVAYGRAVVTGGAYPDPTKRMRLRIIYSKI